MHYFGITDDPWAFLRTNTSARIAQGRAGHSLPTDALLNFQLDHARARDAVYSELDLTALLNQLRIIRPGPLLLQSQASHRSLYLQRPDLGRKLAASSSDTLVEVDRNRNSSESRSHESGEATLAIVIVDGLSATAINQHALPIVTALVHEVNQIGWSIAPLCVVQQGRVAIGDEIAHALKAEMVLVLIGERPGLSSPDSLGAYLTYQPNPGLTDESRNCVSNIRPEGLPYNFAVQKLLYLLTEMKIRRLSGVALKDEMPTHTLPHTSYPAGIAQIPETPD